METAVLRTKIHGKLKDHVGVSIQRNFYHEELQKLYLQQSSAYGIQIFKMA